MIMYVLQPAKDSKLECKFGGWSMIEAAVRTAKGPEMLGQKAMIITIH